MAAILIVEDNVDNLQLMADYLSSRGYQVFSARSGSDALTLLADQAVDIILMDIHLPGMDGLEATRRIRSDTRHTNTPIIAVTAMAMIGDRERCMDAGATEYLSKPVTMRQLGITIASYLC